MRRCYAALACLILIACGDPSGPELDLSGEYVVTGVGLGVGVANWNPVPSTYDVFRDQRCVRTLENGTLEIAGGSYSLHLRFDEGCAGYFPQVIDEVGEVKRADGGIWYMPDGITTGGDVCGSWLGLSTDEGELGLISPVAHPCLGGAIWFFRFEPAT